MPTYHRLGLLAACILVASCAGPSGAAATPGEAATPGPLVTVIADGEGDEVTVGVAGESVIIDVHSRSGIGSAMGQLLSTASAENIVLRLHLQGLEAFHLLYDETAIMASVSSSDSGRVMQSVRPAEGDELPITSDSPYWLDIKIVSEQATPSIPLDTGYFEIRLPEDFGRAGSHSFSIRWIDFYR